MAVPPPVSLPRVPATAAKLDWHHPGKPDLTDAAVRAALPVDLRVALSGADHRFIDATPCLKWQPAPGATPADPPIGMSIPQEQFDLLCAHGGVASQWLRAEQDILLLSHVPDHGANMADAWTLVGGLSLDEKYTSIPTLLKAISLAKIACGLDKRLELIKDAFFKDEKRPLSGSGAASARNWMYSFSGEMLMGLDGKEMEAFALMRLAVEPKRWSLNRDLAKDPYCRFLQSLKTMAASRSVFIASQLNDPLTPEDEIAEYIADLWKQLVASGYPFILRGTMVQKNLELNSADSLVNGTEAERESAFKSMFSGMVGSHPFLSRCVIDKDAGQCVSSLLGNFEQVAGIVLPGVVWSSAYCMKSVEHELNKMKLESLIDTWGSSPIDGRSSAA